MTVDLSIFKDYDIRGVYPTQINGEVFGAIAHAIVREFSPKSVCICRDMRLSGDEIKNAFADVFTSLGVDVYDAGLVGTEMQYYIAGTKDIDLVIMISASHNPKEYNGMKMVKKGPIAVTSESGMNAVRDRIKEGPLPPAKTPGNVYPIDVWDEWKEKILSLVDTKTFKPLSVVIDGGNGMAGTIVTKLFSGLPFSITPLFFEPDGNFPNHTPNPLIPENNAVLSKTILEKKADVGLTFDGDADRMFLVDNTGRIIPGTITTALLARYFLKKYPKEIILYNAICGRVVPKIITQYGGTPKRVRVGHSYIKTYMRETNAIFAGEHSGHYYYRDFYRAESGVLTALLILSLLSAQDKPLSSLVDELDIYPSSGEINFTVSDIPTTVETIRKNHADAKSIDDLDGLSVWYESYWFNVRASKTEPLLRLNVEADTKEILAAQTEKLLAELVSLGAKRK